MAVRSESVGGEEGRDEEERERGTVSLFPLTSERRLHAVCLVRPRLKPDNPSPLIEMPSFASTASDSLQSGSSRSFLPLSSLRLTFDDVQSSRPKPAVPASKSSSPPLNLPPRERGEEVRTNGVNRASVRLSFVLSISDGRIDPPDRHHSLGRNSRSHG
jgi:hypothetical protein